MDAESKHQKESKCQEDLIAIVGKGEWATIPPRARMVVRWVWLRIIEVWEAGHGGEVPTEAQLEWMYGVWLHQPPIPYLASLAVRADSRFTG